MRTMSTLALLSACLACAPALAQDAARPRLDYPAAKAKADKDETSLDRLSAETMLRTQSRTGEMVVETCADPKADTSPFTVVARLDADGKVVDTWREGDTALAKCFEQRLWGHTLAVPPRTPFYVSFEMSFTP